MGEVTISKPLFGGEIDFVIYDAPQDVVEGVVEEVYAEALRLQEIFNMYSPDSEVSSLNASRRAAVSDALLDVLGEALAFSRLTDGSYDVTLGKSILSRKKGEIMVPDCSYKDVLIEGDEVALTHPDVLLDLGSIAKGYIVDRLAECLQEDGVAEFLIDARGDIRVAGERAHVLGLQDPRGETSVCSIRLQDEAVATSGDYKQYARDFSTSHIVNQKDTISVTVVAPTLEEADAYATALFTCTAREQRRLLDANKGIRALIIKEGGSLMFNGFETLLHEGPI